MERLIRYWTAICSRLRKRLYQLRGMRFGGSAWLQKIEVAGDPACISLGDGCALDRGVTLLMVNTSGHARLEVGARCYINRQTMIDVSESVSIGSDSMIGPYCYITDHDHAVSPGLPPSSGPLVSSAVRIGERCWIGAHVSILKGVRIGDNSVIGAGSVVTKAIPENSVAVGNPARVLRTLAAS